MSFPRPLLRGLTLLTISGCLPTAAPEQRRSAWWTEIAPRLGQASLAFRATDHGYQASAPDGLGVLVDADGALLRLGDDKLRLSLRAWGREGAGQRAPATTPTPGPCLPSGETLPDGTCARGLAQDHGGITTFWTPRTQGLQQSWEIAAPPPGPGPLVLAVQVDGASVTVDADGQGAWLDGDQGAAIRYDELAAWDAEGEPLDAWMEEDAQGLWIRVDDTGAAWPITVDPIASTATTTLTGSATGGRFGYAVSGAGDVNNDGYGDVVVGAPWASSAAGAVYVYHGTSTGLRSTATRTISGGTAGNYLGYSVDGAGDVNNDGYDDIVVGAPGVGSLRGAAYVYHGGSSGVSASATTSLSGAATGDQLGFAVAGAGDVNNDGYDDVIVGANAASSNAGAAYVYHGASSGVSSSASRSLSGSSGAYFGQAVAGAGDLDADGYADVIIGAPGVSSSRGAAYVYEGSSSGVGSTGTTLSGPSASAYYGASVDAAGDVNGDGYGDIIVGATGVTSGVGAAYVYHGRSSTVSTTATSSLSGRAATGYFGISVAGLGDVDGDGYDDVLVGAYGASTGTGAAYEFPGSSSGVSTSPDTSLTGSATYAYFGVWVAAAGDVDGDGYADAVVGAYGVSSNTGAIYLYLGEAQDADGDGYDATEDCDDTDARVYPGATESPGDGVDSDCDDAETCYVDSDNDGYRTTGTTTSADTDCADSGEAGSSEPSGDCDDSDSRANPGATEITGDGVDEDCDGDETCYVDQDADGHRTDTTIASADEDCDDRLEAVSTDPSDDCDDDDATVYPGATETVGDGLDQDCDGSEDCYKNVDGDAYRSDDTTASDDADCDDRWEADSSTEGGDCDDEDSRVYPGAEEKPYDGIDQDCDGADLLDVDSDGHDAEEAGGDDCDDEDPATYPGATEVDDGADNDCDGTVDTPGGADSGTDGGAEGGTDGGTEGGTEGSGQTDGGGEDGGTDGGDGSDGSADGGADGTEGGADTASGGGGSGGCSFGLDPYKALLLVGLGGLARRRGRRPAQKL